MSEMWRHLILRRISFRPADEHCYVYEVRIHGCWHGVQAHEKYSEEKVMIWSIKLKVQ